MNETTDLLVPFVTFSTRTKRYTRDGLLQHFNEHRDPELIIGLTNGAFDLLHAGHVSHLEQCRSMCSALVVCVNIDEWVTANKGSGRPHIKLGERMLMLAALECVDYVIPFAEDNACECVRLLDPDVYIKDEPYRGKLPEAEFARAVGYTQGRVQSTTDIMEKLGMWDDG